MIPSIVKDFAGWRADEGGEEEGRDWPVWKREATWGPQELQSITIF